MHHWMTQIFTVLTDDKECQAFLFVFRDSPVQDLLPRFAPLLKKMALPRVRREDDRESNSSRLQTDEIVTVAASRQRRLNDLLRTLEQLSWRSYLKRKTRGVR